jgi:hypothetical protein
LRAGLAVAVLVLVLGVVEAAAAHVTRDVGPLTVTIGWGNEPPLAGFENSVEVGVSDASGAPVADLGSAPEVEVAYGDAQTTVALVPTEEPGEFRAALVPTRPGTYAFRLTATVDGREINTGASCSERTFECVVAASEVEFPVKDPSIGEVAERLTSELPRAEQATDEAASARRIAIVAIVLAALAMAAAIAIVVRERRKSP